MARADRGVSVPETHFEFSFFDAVGAGFCIIFFGISPEARANAWASQRGLQRPRHVDGASVGCLNGCEKQFARAPLSSSFVELSSDSMLVVSEMVGTLSVVEIRTRVPRLQGIRSRGSNSRANAKGIFIDLRRNYRRRMAHRGRRITNSRALKSTDGDKWKRWAIV
ncbi:hypothetical protein FGB62_74g122 [Gracilaria domingensis]|nr:hypothetical protein FGB62_74g122 [Gracilaria domingensis]